MSRHIGSRDRNQLMFPISFDEMVPEDAEVRAIDAIVDKLDIHALGFTYSETKQTGRKPYDPVDMFKLYAYAYYNGTRSSRRIEKECHRNIELMWLIGSLTPDFKTIADFRKNNKDAIKEAFKRFSLICSELGLIGKEIVAVDGSKFRACNSRMAYHSKAKIEKKLEHHTKMADQYMKLLDTCDEDEAESAGITREELLAKIDRVNKRIVELSILKEEVIQNGTQYDTDPDSRMMKSNNHGADICHNVQIAVDDTNHFVVAVDVTSQPVGKEQLYNIASQAKSNLDVESLTVIADKGYYSAYQFAQCENDSIIPIVSKADRSFLAATEAYSKEAFQYDEARAGYICPEGHFFKPYRMRETCKNKGHIRYENKIACMNCGVKHLCTEGKVRTIADRPYEEYARIVDKRTQESKEMCRQRKQLVEHPWGTIKRAWGFSYFLTRGTDNVRTESLLHFLIYNLKRAINLVGTQELVGALKA